MGGLFGYTTEDELLGRHYITYGCIDGNGRPVLNREGRIIVSSARMYTPSEMNALLSEAGFKIAEGNVVGHPGEMADYAVVASKAHD